MMDNKYIKIVYQSEPIGKEGIILELTTLDLEAFKQDENLKKIPKKKEYIYLEYGKNQLGNSICETINELNDKINNEINLKYKKQIDEMKSYLEYLRKDNINLYEVENYIKQDLRNAKDIINADNVRCNMVYGDIKNCNNIYCNGIKGNVINCDKIIYR